MSKVYKKAGKENVCGKEKTIYELDDEKYIKQKGKDGDNVYIQVKKYVEKKKAMGECLNPLIDRRLQILNKIWKKSSAVKEVVDTSSARRRASAARKASSARRRASAARKASSARRRASAARKASSARRRASAARKASSARRRASAARKASSARRRASAARKASSARRRASAARKASSSRRRASVARREKEVIVPNITNSSSFKLSPGRARTPVIFQAPRRFTLSETRISNKPASSIKKQCKVNCEKNGKVCNTKTGRCIKPKKIKSIIVKKAKLEVFAERPCKQDCTALNKICKVSTRRCVNPPKAKPKLTAANFKPCKKECGEGKKCNFLSGRCIKQK